MIEVTYIALLRGINVGGKVLKMPDLKQAVADLGFRDVRTYVQSGNLVLRAEGLAAAEVASLITKAVAGKRGILAQVLAYDAGDWQCIVSNNPFKAAEPQPKTLHAFLLAAQPEKQRQDDLAARDWGNDEWKIVGDALYMHTPDGFGKSRLAQSVERLLKVPMTARNWSTILALQQMAQTTT